MSILSRPDALTAALARVVELEAENANLKRDNVAFREFVAEVLIQARGVVENG